MEISSRGRPTFYPQTQALVPFLMNILFQTRIAPGFSPEAITVTKQLFKITTWKGPIDAAYLNNVKAAYEQAIMQLAGDK